MLQKQPININFSKGVDTKTDDKQIQVGNFLSLNNTVFTKAGLLQKRNGFDKLSLLPTSNHYSYLTTFNDNLTAIDTNIAAYSETTTKWATKGYLKPMSLSTEPLIRNSLNQSYADTAVYNGSICTVYTESTGSSVSYKYSIADVTTGQNIISPTAIPVTSGVVTGSPRVFALAGYFVIVFTNVIATVSHLQYISINALSPTTVTSNVDVASSYIPATTLSWDGIVYNNRLFISFYTTLGGSNNIRITYLTPLQAATGAAPITPTIFNSQLCTIMSLSSDSSTNNIYLTWYNLGTTTGKTAAVDQNLNVVLSPTIFTTIENIVNLTSSTSNTLCSIIYEVSDTYPSPISLASNYIRVKTVTVGGTVLGPNNLILSVGLASKAFTINNNIYFLSVYQSAYQSTYFLIDATNCIAGTPSPIARLAYQNAGGYLTTGLPSVFVNNTVVQIPYLYKDLIQPVNKDTNVSSTTQVAGIYSQLGINLATFDISSSNLNTIEVANNLHINGGLMWAYDGYTTTEQGFLLYPDDVAVATATGSGSIAADTYYYQVTYEWTDNQGNAFKSAPSIPVKQVTTTASSTNTITVPTLRLTYKNNAKIVVYRWSVAQPIYYQVTSISTPVLNSLSASEVTITDSASNATILGNSILYTTGGVVEDIAPPAVKNMTLFDTRLWLIDAEDQNLLWFSKQIIEATPVEMSDLFTIYVAPNIGTSQSTGPMQALAAMDDKLIIFKKDAIYYMNGQGPDNTGSSNQYSQPIFVTSTAGCSNTKSIVLTPNGIMFQSDKGIWILGRDLSTNYIGAPVEKYNSDPVLSAVSLPTANQVRFTLTSGIILVYDYYYGQWSTFSGINPVSSCIYQSSHSLVDINGKVFKESKTGYLDDTQPVLISFQTGWINLAGIQGFERFYFMYLLGSYFTPFKLLVNIGYDYNNSSSQQITINPDNYNANWGGEALWGSGETWGGNSNVFEARVFPQQQKCETFQLTINEQYDPSLGVAAGQGLSLSGITVVSGIKRGFRTQNAKKSYG